MTWTGIDIGNKVHDLLNKYVEESAHKRAGHLELLAQAFLQETGLNPSQVELVEERKDNKVIWYFRERTVR